MASDVSYRVELLYRPGRKLPDAELARLVGELRGVAGTCFDPIPTYQCLVGTRDALSDKLIALARRPDGGAAGFCSAVILPVPKVGDVLHLGLTCVRPDARSGRLTTRLLSKLVIPYFWRHRGLRRVWCSNVACVLSSLGNVALHFGRVYPSPFGPERPSAEHLRIARAIDASYRREIHIDPGAVLDLDAFVFRGSVPGTVFQKSADDSRFYHRDRDLNDYYRNRMRFEDGDEVLQVGCMDLGVLLAFLRKQLRRGRGRGAKAQRPAPSATGG